MEKKMTRNPNNRNPYMTDFQVLSRKQIELGIEIRAYRGKNKLSCKQFAMIASAYGAPYKVKFADLEISRYERFLTIPSEKKMYALLNTLHITLDTLGVA